MYSHIAQITAYKHFCSDHTVHLGLLNSGVKDYAGLVDQVSRCLRPGGLVLFAEFDFRIWSEDKRLLIPPNFYTPLPTEGRPSLGLSGSSGGGSGSVGAAARSGKVPTVLTNWAMPTWMAMMSKCVRAKGGNIDAAAVILLSSCNTMNWLKGILLQLLKKWMGEHRSYVDVQAVDLWAPVGHWKGQVPGTWPVV